METSAEQPGPSRVVVAGATGYLGRFVAHEFARRGHRVRVLTRSLERLRGPGPFSSPAIAEGDVDEVFVGEVTRPETLEGLVDGADLLFSSVGISRQRDGLSFDQVDHRANRNLLDCALAGGVRKLVYVSMLGHEQIAHLAITKAHERVVEAIAASGIDHTIVRPSGYFSDMGAVLDMARRGRVLLVGEGHNRFNPIHGADLARVCVDAALGEAREVEAGGPDVLTQREVAEIAFRVLGRPAKVMVVPMWLARGLVGGIRLLSRQLGDLAEFIVTAGEVDAVAPRVDGMRLEDYFRALAGADAVEAGRATDQ